MAAALLVGMVAYAYAGSVDEQVWATSTQDDCSVGDTVSTSQVSIDDAVSHVGFIGVLAAADIVPSFDAPKCSDDEEE